MIFKDTLNNDVKLNYQKYKRALAMSKYCYAMAHTEYAEYRDEVLFYMRWYENWYKIANILKTKVEE